MQTEEIALSRLVENKENPRNITETNFQKLVKSLLVFPRMLTLRPIVVDDKFTVLGGNMRLKALCHITTMQEDGIVSKLEEDSRLTEAERSHILGYWKQWQKKPTATIVRADDLTEAQKREFIIKDNASFGEWDYNEISNKWTDLPLTDWSLNVWTPSTGNVPSPAGSPSTENAVDVSEDVAGELPQELQGKDLTPDDLPKIEGDDATAMERIIITFKKEDASYLAALLGLASIDKVLYTVDELKDKNGSES